MSSSAPAAASSDSATPRSQPIPRWVPVSLLALTTAALVVPVALLKRHRANVLGKALHDTAPPPRRTASTGGNAVAPTSAPLASAPGSARTASKPLSTPTPKARPEDDFNFALYGAKAFGYATLIVTASAAVTVWGVKTYMGVRDTQEFAERMRVLVRTKLPVLSSRIHRPPADEDHTATIRNDPAHVEAPEITLDSNAHADWAWPDAEKRLSAAYERDGFSGWAQAALQELEAEGRAERRRRGHE